MALSPDSLRRLNDWVTWFNYHSSMVDTYPPEKKIEWMLKAINGAFDMITVLANEEQTRSTGTAGRADNGILIPKSWRFSRGA
jgi:hypothetical protein